MKPASDTKAHPTTPAAAGAVSKPDGASKRRFDRFAWKTQVQVLWLEEHGRGTSVTLRTDDLSAGGMALLSSSWIYPGRRGAVLLAGHPGQPSIRWVEVLHGRYVSERKAHVIGCKWIPTPENAPPVRITESSTGPQLEFDTDLPAQVI